MKKVTINPDLCSGCGMCADVCPHQLLQVEADVASVLSGDCMECGHCQAVCPQGAVEVDGIASRLGLKNIADSQKVVNPGDYDCDSLVQLMRSRRSCRNYTSQNVELSILEDLVRIGTTAPSGTNSQSWNFVILPERSDVEVLGGLTADFYRKLNVQASNPLYRFLAILFAGDKLGQYYRNYYASVREALREWDEDGVDRLFHGASAALLVTGKRSASCPGEDAMLATQNILLAAHALGLGSCLIGFVVEAMRRRPIIKRLVSIPADEEIYSVIGLGYPAIPYFQVAGRRVVQPKVVHLASG